MLTLRQIAATAGIPRLPLTGCRKYSKTKVPPTQWPHKIISGVQPTGVLHLGNYLGAIKRWTDIQNSGADVTYFIADMHSITLPQVRDNIRS